MSEGVRIDAVYAMQQAMLKQGFKDWAFGMRPLMLPAGFYEKRLELREDARVEEVVGSCGFRRHWLTGMVVMEWDWDVDYTTVAGGNGMFTVGHKRWGLEMWTDTKASTSEETRRELMEKGLGRS